MPASADLRRFTNEMADCDGVAMRFSLTSQGYVDALHGCTVRKASFGAGTPGQVFVVPGRSRQEEMVQAMARGIAFFHLPWDFRINSTTSRIAPLPPSTVVM